MTKITAQEAAHNFNTLKALLLATAPSQKAVDFASRIFAQVEARGGDWMAEKAAELQILSPYGSVEEDRNSPASVADNRPYFMGKLQSAVL